MLDSLPRGQGQLEEAAVIREAVLDKKRILSDEHPSTISAISNLAITLGDKGRLEESDNDGRGGRENEVDSS